MAFSPNILCIGAVLWDIIGRCDDAMVLGNDKPGQITRIPGGVALNIAMTLTRFGLRPALLSVIGEDAEGRELRAACAGMGLDVSALLIDVDLPTDRYMAIEAQGNLIAAIAHAHSLEKAGARILAPLSDGRIADAARPWQGPVAVDGNLTLELLTEISTSPLFAHADLRAAPASPGKAERLKPFLTHPNATLYVNVEEAGLIANASVNNAVPAAQALLNAGAQRVLVTQGAEMAVDATPERTLTARPPQITARRITGAGDTFMAAHIAAETGGDAAQDALNGAVQAAAAYVSGTSP